MRLALSRRQVCAYYASGERPVPRYILLAMMKGWEVEREEAGGVTLNERPPVC